MRVLMGDGRPGYSRRSVLRAIVGGLTGTGAVAVSAACDPAPPARPHRTADPLNPFYRDTAALLARYESTIAAQPDLAPRLTPLRDAHRAHLSALAREIGPNLEDPAPTASPTGPAQPVDAGSTVAGLRDAEQQAAAAARAACLAGPSYRAGLLGMIAAARSSHVEVLS